MAQPKGVSIRRRNGRTRCSPAAFGGSEIKPPGPKTCGPFQIIEAQIDVAFGVVAILGNDVGPRPGQERHSHLADSDIYVFHPGTISAHVQWIKVVDVDVLTSVVSFSCPELGVRLALKSIADLNEGFTKAELVVTRATREICVVRTVRGVGLYHDLRFHPDLIGIVLRVYPVVDEDQLRRKSLLHFPTGIWRRRLEPGMPPVPHPRCLDRSPSENIRGIQSC